MALKIQKLNKTHNGHEWFKWRVLIGKSATKDNVRTSAAGNVMLTNPRLRFVEFAEARNFCWATFGPSCELEIYGAIKGLTRNGPLSNPNWAWRFGSMPRNSPEEGYIYVAGQEEIMLLQLKYGST